METLKTIISQLPPSSPSNQPLPAPREIALTVQLSEGNGYPSVAWPELTAEEEQDALQVGVPALLIQAQKEKHYRLEREKADRKMRELAFVPNTPELLFSEVQKRAWKLAAERQWRKAFTLDEYNTAIYKLLAMYFTGDPRFETDGPKLIGVAEGSLSLSKGLILAGGVGIGKTVMMQLYARNPYQPYSVVSCLDLETDYDKEGPKILDAYSVPQGNGYLGHFYGHEKLGTCFDDYGAEQSGKFYAKSVNVLEKILHARYRTCPGPLTHLTTNARIAELEASTDGRVFDRMVEMFNLIEFSELAPSRRI